MEDTQKQLLKILSEKIKKKHKKKKKKVNLPQRIIPISNPDKEFHESWSEDRDPLNIPHPYRACLFGKPNVGKTTIALNLLLRADPPFKKVFIIHLDSDFSQEYDEVDCEFLDEIPSPQEWVGDEKTLVVLDDLEFKNMSKQQKSHLSRLMGYVSTHKNISIILTCQDGFEVPSIVRRCANLWVLWKSKDIDSLNTIGRRAGLEKKKMKKLFDKYIQKNRDSLWIDLTNESPYPMRKNGFESIQYSDDES